MFERSRARELMAGVIILAIVGWGGLALLFTFTVPTVWPRWLFFLLWVMALTALALPITQWLNARHDAPDAPELAVVVRQAVWVGVLGATLAWLQLGRLASLWLVIGLSAGLGGIEYFIRIRERAQRRPGPPESQVKGRAA